MILFFAMLFAFRADASECKGFFPKNDFYISETMSDNSLAKSTFNRTLDKFEKVWAPVVKAKGYNLVIRRLWSDGTVNSDTDVIGNTWEINSYGGLARFPSISTDAFMLVACHELGHHLGGAPLYSDSDWASAEGEADYWATIKCAKVMFGNDQARIVKASLNLVGVLAKLGDEKKPKVETPDQSVVRQTDESHPAAQCRLDTYVTGMKCKASGNMSDTDPKVGSCYPSGIGSRPLCWFKP